jgi:hypothetical protein
MKKRLLWVFLMLAFCATAALAFDPSDLNKITFKNSTSGKITAIYLSPSDSEQWGPDILGADYVLTKGSSIGYMVHFPGSSFSFDILAINDKQAALELDNSVLKDGKETVITFTDKNMRKDAPDFDFVTMTIGNETGYDVHYLFVSPADSDAWGVDLLDEDTILSEGDEFSVNIPVEGTTKYNVMAADEDYDVYDFDISINPKKGADQSFTIEADDLSDY